MALASCTTSYLWEHTDPYVALSQDNVTEAQLATRNLKYIRDDEFDLFYVQKEGLQRYKDYALRTFGTPITIVVDTAATSASIVIGGMALFVLAPAGTNSTEVLKGTVEVFEQIAKKLNLKKSESEHVLAPYGVPGSVFDK